MKTLIITGLTCSTILLACHRNLAPDKVPALVNNSLKVRFAGATNLSWEKVENQYEAEFDISGVEVTALFDAGGNLLRHKEDLAVANLPVPVLAAVQNQAPGFIIDDLEKLDSQGQVYYQVELENKQKELKQVYTADGKIAGTISYWD